jgi:F0F1-type ATP synthase membrane subunit a
MRPPAMDRATRRGGEAMSTSKTIAALLGPTMIVSAVAVLANLEAWPGYVEEAVRSPAMVLLAGYLSFVPGLAIVHFHNRWTGGWPVLVTVMGWIMLAGGFARIVFPVKVGEIGTRIVAAPSVLLSFAVVFLLIGGFLSFKAYGRE